MEGGGVEGATMMDDDVCQDIERYPDGVSCCI